MVWLEVETKIKIADSEVPKFRKRIKEIGKFEKKGKKADDYFAIQKELNVELGETTKDKMFSVYKTSCIGCCDEAPAMLVDGKPYTKLTIERVKELLKELKKNANS